jgi:hypothetical protein
LPNSAPRQIRTSGFPASGSSANVARGDSRPTTFRSPGDMSCNVKALDMGPSGSSHRHGPPLLGRVQGCPCSPTSSLVCSPPTPCLLRPRLRFPLPRAYLAAGASSVPFRPTTRAPATCRASETGHRLSVTPGYVEERRGPPRLRGRPLRTCHGRTPRRIPPPPRPEMLAGDGCCLQGKQAPGHPGRLEVSGPHAPWPTRSPAYASPGSFLAPSQGWLPARAGSPLAGQDSHLLDDTQSFMKASHPPVPIDPHCLVALFFLYSC